MRSCVLVFFVLTLSILGADTPLSAVLIEGEGWKLVTGDTTKPPVKPTAFLSKKDSAGNWVIEHEGKVVATSGDGETFGAVALSPRGGKLIVAVPSQHYLYAFQVNTDGTLWAKEKTYTLRREKIGKGGSNVGSMAFDTKGRLWTAMPEGIQFFDEEMRFSGQLSRPERANVSHVWFAGDAKDELHIVCGEKIWKRKVKATGP